MTMTARRVTLIITIALTVLLTLTLAFAVHATNPVVPTKTTLAVPYIPQVYHNQWVNPWDEACEEASITMIDNYYAHQSSMQEADAKKNMQRMFDWEMKTFNKKNDTNATETQQVIAANSSFQATIKRKPTLDDIKRELNAQRPVIALVNMYQLYHEPNQGDSFHVLVITGYDDTKQQFLLNDPARPNHKVSSYDRLMGALHDYNETSKEGDGEATVLFTRSTNMSPRLLINWFLSIFS